MKGPAGPAGPPGPPNGGAVYVRWGRKSCPGNTTLLYKGMRQDLWVFAVKVIKMLV